MLQRMLLVLFLALFLAACEPVGPIPGRGLSGTETANPSSWAFLQSVEVIQLETEGRYSVNIWIVGSENYGYVAAADGAGTKWSQNISVDPEVRLRVGDKIYDLVAKVVKDPAELEMITTLYKEKYSLDAQEDFPEAIVYRLEPR